MVKAKGSKVPDSLIRKLNYRSPLFAAIVSLVVASGIYLVFRSLAATPTRTVGKYLMQLGSSPFTLEAVSSDGSISTPFKFSSVPGTPTVSAGFYDTFSPSGRRVATDCTSIDDATHQLCIFGSSGLFAKRIDYGSNDRLCYSPQWTPSEGKLFFTSIGSSSALPPKLEYVRSGKRAGAAPNSQGAGCVLHSINTDGTGLATISSPDQVYGLSISPDGSKLAYFTAAADGSLVIKTADLDLGNATTILTLAPQGAAGCPCTSLITWSSDGSKLAFNLIQDDGTGAGNTIDHLEVANADGSGLTSLDTSPVNARFYAANFISADSRLIYSVQQDVASPIVTYTIGLDGSAKTLFPFNGQLVAAQYITKSKPRPNDYRGRGAGDMAVFRPSNSGFYEYSNGATAATGTARSVSLSAAGVGATMLPAQADYDGDGTTDEAVYNQASDRLSVYGGVYNGFAIGSGSCLPVPADYDGDGKADPAAFCQPQKSGGTTTWYIYKSSLGRTLTYSWGRAGDIPVPADYAGKGYAQIVVFRPNNGKGGSDWLPVGSALTKTTWGRPGDMPVVADFNGDGNPDWGNVYRPSTHQFISHKLKSPVAFGMVGDVPTWGNYYGAGKDQFSVYRRSALAYLVLGHSTVKLGATGDIPLDIPIAIYINR